MIQVYPNSTYFRGHNNVDQVTPDGPIKITAATSITQNLSQKWIWDQNKKIQNRSLQKDLLYDYM